MFPLLKVAFFLYFNYFRTGAPLYVGHLRNRRYQRKKQLRGFFGIKAVLLTPPFMVFLIFGG